MGVQLAEFSTAMFKALAALIIASNIMMGSHSTKYLVQTEDDNASTTAPHTNTAPPTPTTTAPRPTTTTAPPTTTTTAPPTTTPCPHTDNDNNTGFCQGQATRCNDPNIFDFCGKTCKC